MSVGKDDLLDYLDKHAFDPVLRASKDAYNDEAQRELLASLQKKTQDTKRNYHRAKTIQGIVDSYEQDINSETAAKVNRQLNRLGLPTLEDVEEGFNDLTRGID